MKKLIKIIKFIGGIDRDKAYVAAAIFYTSLLAYYTFTYDAYGVLFSITMVLNNTLIWKLK